ncbi:MAG: hypothetical protein LBT12_05660 [Oscillospiraceae bacterium]|jgi:hypothetical protein|nr:hypothetical protein [Oscillospiraceae bacterium]
MIQIALKNIRLLEVGEGCEPEHYGCDQEWYGSRWRRASGCGPSVVSNIFSYISRAESGARAAKSDFTRLMDEVWGCVTPTVRGLPSTAALCAGIDKYIAYKGCDLTWRELSVPGRSIRRPSFDEVLDFLGEALAADTPVAFLVLDGGGLDEWHWVTIVSLVFDKPRGVASVGIVDSGRLFGADLYNWFRTTTRGGGFVSLRRASEQK